MKKLLSVTVLLACVIALVPVHAFAAFRGVWDPITNGDPFFLGLPNGAEQAALRRGVNTATGGHANVERWFAFSSRFNIFQFETSRSIWLGRNQDQVAFRVADILDARRPLIIDPTALISYTDPAWSPNGKYLAYVQTNRDVTVSSIYVQEFSNSTSSAVAATPVGSPLFVVAAVAGAQVRAPAWNPDGTALAYYSSNSGLSLDIYTVSVDVPSATVGAPVRITMDDAKGETDPDWGPGRNGGTLGQIAYATNKFGRNVIEIKDLDDGTTRLAETNFAGVSHNNPSWTADGASIYYDAPRGEDINNTTDIWKLTLANQSKCDIFLDNFGDYDPYVSKLDNVATDGTHYNLFLCSSLAAGFGQCVWRGSPILCAPALPIGVDLSPTTINLDQTTGGPNGNGKAANAIDVIITMPAETQAAGFRAIATDDEHFGPGGGGLPPGTEGIKNRRTIVASPTFLGLTTAFSDILLEITGSTAYGQCNNSSSGGDYNVTATYDRKRIENRLISLGLINTNVECPVTAYSSTRGRQFKGSGILHVSSNSLSGQLVRLQQNSPNPFNPVTKINWVNAKPGVVNVRIFNVRGELVKTIASGVYGVGTHEATWDGSTNRGAKATSGVYFAKASSTDEKGREVTSDVIKMVMAK